LIVVMAASTFITQRQLMARNAASGGVEVPQQQKTLMYILPLVFALFGFKFPLGVLLYWLTTNFWSMGQQAVVIRRMDAQAAAATAGPTVTTAGPRPGAKPSQPQPRAALVSDSDAGSTPDGDNPPSPPNGSKPVDRPPAKPAGRPPGRSRNKRKGGRR
jgi:YidC/Oxa1 family membrane protein insertase